MENDTEQHRFPYFWKLKESNFKKDKGKVFSCFACGGGSTMGYKLAGFDVIGCNEIDERMNKLYVANNDPKYNFVCDIRDMVKMKYLPEELYSLDILDGSPPCSSFSTFGKREEDWGKKKKFAEGQKEQVLDTLFFDFIELAAKLKPKIVIAENVKGLLVGNAVSYLEKIEKSFDNAGYYVEKFLLNGKDMGVPQRRERVFFICLRKDLIDFVPNIEMIFDKKPYISMYFNEKPITLGEVSDFKGKRLSEKSNKYKLWKNRKRGDRNLGEANMRLTGKTTNFGERLNYKEDVSKTITSGLNTNIHFEEPCFYSDSEIKKISTFPDDYDFMGQSVCYVCGMSVPPVMMAQVASNVWEQWLSKINSKQ